MSSTLVYIIGAVILDGCAALAGLFLPEKLIHAKRSPLLGFAAGMMLAVALLEILPEAFEASLSIQRIGVLAGAGFSAFFLMEQFLGAHSRQHADTPHHGIGPALLVGDALHNIADGVTVAAAFLTDTYLGVTTAVAVFFHELPQETGDFAILRHLGYSKRKALTMLFVVQFTALIGALATYFAFQWVESIVPALLAFSAGGFIYISAVNLIPELFKAPKTRAERRENALFFLAGVALIALFQYLGH